VALLGPAMALALACALPSAAQTPTPKPDLGKILGSVIKDKKPGGGLTAADANAGLKEALNKAATTVSAQLGKQDGYFGDAKIRIPLPGFLGDTQKKLKPFGMSNSLDDLQLRMNRAAEQAAPQAKKLMIDAVTAMTFDDAMGIVKGGETSATDFLKRKTTTNLQASLRPYVTKALSDAGALSALDRAVSKYGMGLAPPDTRGWLTDKAVAGALDGLFYYVAQEERSIRQDPGKRSSDLLRRVFGS
jgi:hypothetical protein